MADESAHPEGPAEPTIAASVDHFDFPACVRGWAVKRLGTALAVDLRIEALRDGVVLATAYPSFPRPDVAGNDEHLAGFVLDCGDLASAEELLDGTVLLRAIDPDGDSAPIPIALALRAWRKAEVETVLPILAELAANPRLAGAAAAAVLRAQQALGTSPPRMARPGPKITFIGAGSTVFAKNLLGDILLHPALTQSRIVLYDIDPERLRVSEIVARRINQTLGTAATITATLDLGAALDGADYAINMIQVGGYRPCTVTDFDVPKQFGLRQTIADTLGIGGIMRALRTIPVQLDMAREMERRCPDVLHLNYANPMAMTCWALSRGSRINTVGLCHSVPHTAAELAQDIGVPVERIDYLVAGINHMAFYLKFESEGVDLYPRLHQVIAEGRVPPGNRVRYDMLQRLGYFVTESSEHFAEYVPWFIKQGQAELIQTYNIPLDEYPRRCESQVADWEQLSKVLTDPAVPLNVTQSQEYGAHIINAIETGEPAVIYGNVPNRGLITNLPEGCCVELPCLVDHNGVRPVAVGALPLHLAALMQTNINVQALTVEAALTGKRAHIYHAAMLDPHTAAELNLDQIWHLVDAMLAAHKDWIPAFAQT
jgi:alpha-galactosidase